MLAVRRPTPGGAMPVAREKVEGSHLDRLSENTSNNFVDTTIVFNKPCKF